MAGGVGCNNSLSCQTQDSDLLKTNLMIPNSFNVRGLSGLQKMRAPTESFSHERELVVSMYLVFDPVHGFRIKRGENFSFFF